LGLNACVFGFLNGAIMKISQRHAARLGICAAAVVMVSSLGALIAGGTDGSAAAANDQKTVGSTPPPEQRNSSAGYSVSMNVQHLDQLK